MSQTAISADFEGYDLLAQRRGYLGFFYPFCISIHFILFTEDSFSGITKTNKRKGHGQDLEDWES